MAAEIRGIYRIPDARMAGYRVQVQDADGSEWDLTLREYEARGYRPDALSLPLMEAPGPPMRALHQDG